MRQKYRYVRHMRIKTVQVTSLKPRAAVTLACALAAIAVFAVGMWYFGQLNGPQVNQPRSRAATTQWAVNSHTLQENCMSA